MIPQMTPAQLGQVNMVLDMGWYKKIRKRGKGAKNISLTFSKTYSIKEWNTGTMECWEKRDWGGRTLKAQWKNKYFHSDKE